MAGECADGATAHLLSVYMSSITMDKGNCTRRRQEQDNAEGKENTDPVEPIGGPHDEPGLFVLNRVRIPPPREI
jgi:hypothetical protein